MTYRAAYLNDQQGTRLTGPEQAHLSDAELITAALAEALSAGLVDEDEDDPAESYPALTRKQFDDLITIGDRDD